MASYTMLQNGSQGDEVKKLQQALIDAGYNVGKSGVDGVYGNDTAAAVKQYQKNIGLADNGIADSNLRDLLYEQTGVSNIGTFNTSSKGGLNTGSTSTGGNTNNVNTPTASTTKQETSNAGATTTTPTAPSTNMESDTVKQAQAMLQQQMANKPGAYQSPWQDQLASIISNIQNRDAFSYDLNGEALYQQYKDQYTTQGQMAMMDTMGQAAALTGGYGNSYAQNAGQQAYQAYLQQLNEVVPELYGLALDQYNREGDDMYNQFALLSAQDETDYGRYRDSVSDYYSNLDYLTNRYDTERGFAYEQDRDKVADEQWQKEYDFALQQYTGSKAASSGGSGNGGGTGYDNGDYGDGDVRLAQKYVGASVDGKWGPESAEKAKAMGFNSLADVVAAMDGSPGPEPTKDAYADWDQGDWEHYFAAIRQSEGKAAAEEELNYFTSNGLIPKNMVSYAAIGARGGQMGH